MMLTKPTCDVGFGSLVIRSGENFVRRSKLNQLSVEEESSGIRDTGCLLHVMGHDDDCVLAFEFVKQIFKSQSGGWVKG